MIRIWKMGSAFWLCAALILFYQDDIISDLRILSPWLYSTSAPNKQKQEDALGPGY